MSDWVPRKKYKRSWEQRLEWESKPPQVEHKPKKTPLAIEICCGHAGLSVSLRQYGWDVRPIDWAGNEHKTRIPVINKDLTKPEHVQQVLKLIRKASYVHMAPPCGTASKARERWAPTWNGRRPP